jgi:hypothetical protein
VINIRKKKFKSPQTVVLRRALGNPFIERYLDRLDVRLACNVSPIYNNILLD